MSPANYWEGASPVRESRVAEARIESCAAFQVAAEVRCLAVIHSERCRYHFCPEHVIKVDLVHQFTRHAGNQEQSSAGLESMVQNRTVRTVQGRKLQKWFSSSDELRV